MQPEGEAAQKKYDREDEAYFSYYSMLTHQAQMLQDSVRTSAYQMSIMQHANPFFMNKIVMDVGAGNGILSLFAIQAGARLVYAVEASNVAENLRHLVRAAREEDEEGVTDNQDDINEKNGSSEYGANAWIRHKLAVVHSRVEDLTPSKLVECTPANADVDEFVRVDTIVSECLGVLLVHERMCETFLEARDRFLRPDGAMFPRVGILCFSLLNDPRMWQEVRARGEWWNTDNFYGVDLTPFVKAARAEAYSSPVVGCFSPTHIIGTTPDGANADSAVCRYMIDFSTISQNELREFHVPLGFDCVDEAVVVHGLGAWFDLNFLHSDEHTLVSDTISTYMTTSPFAPPTHWAQVRLYFPEPLALNAGQKVFGTLHFCVNASRSYDITADVYVPYDDDAGPEKALYRRRAFWKLDKQTYSWETL